MISKFKITLAINNDESSLLLSPQEKLTSSLMVSLSRLILISQTKRTPSNSQANQLNQTTLYIIRSEYRMKFTTQTTIKLVLEASQKYRKISSD